MNTNSRTQSSHTKDSKYGKIRGVEVEMNFHASSSKDGIANFLRQ